MALRFAEAGAVVAISDLKQETAQEVSSLITAEGGKACAKPRCDERRELEGLFNETLRHFRKLTILVNNAGGGGPRPFTMPMDDFIWAYRLNLISVFRLCQICAPSMEKEGHGAIININSIGKRLQTG